MGSMIYDCKIWISIPIVLISRGLPEALKTILTVFFFIL